MKKYVLQSKILHISSFKFKMWPRSKYRRDVASFLHGIFPPEHVVNCLTDAAQWTVSQWVPLQLETAAACLQNAERCLYLIRCPVRC